MLVFRQLQRILIQKKIGLSFSRSTSSVLYITSSFQVNSFVCPFGLFQNNKTNYQGFILHIFLIIDNIFGAEVLCENMILIIFESDSILLNMRLSRAVRRLFLEAILTYSSKDRSHAKMNFSQVSWLTFQKNCTAFENIRLTFGEVKCTACLKSTSIVIVSPSSTKWAKFRKKVQFREATPLFVSNRYYLRNIEISQIWL